MKKIIIGILSVICSTSLARAHRVNVFARLENNKVVCQCYYNDGAPVRQQSIQVTAPDGKVVATGKTDDEGIFTFSPDVRADLKIVLSAGMGHAAETIIPEQDIPPIEKKKTPRKSTPEQSSDSEDDNDEANGRVSEELLRMLIEQALEQKLRPITELINKQQQSHSLTAIIGGIGYIVGIFGLFMFWKSRKKR